MIVRRLATFVASTALALAPAGSFANPEEPTASAETTKVAEKDPNEVICKKKSVSGSRLNTVKVCKTRAQWNDTFNSFRAVSDMQNAATANGASQ